ncbi:hypothetical protein HDU82_001339 [Entophlyctis luteolus]|nr:hypothetical protein HDU82_001339 [Entophlyctis luteolus]
MLSETESLRRATFADMNLAKKSIVSAPPDMSIEECLHTMAANNVLAIPVTSRAFPNKYVYILSTLDILLYIVSRKKTHALDLSVSIENAMTMVRYFVFINLTRKYQTKNEQHLKKKDAEMESYRIFERDYRDTLEATMLVFAHGLHRALISDALNVKPPVVLTQSDIISFIHKQIAQSSDQISVFSKSLKELGLVTHRVKTMTVNETAIDGFNRMAAHKILALPVVDEAGLVVSTLSASDLRGLSKDTLEFVHLKVQEFLDKMGSSGKDTWSVTATDTLQDAVNLLVERNAHRLWVLDEMLRPVGVVSQSDVIAAVLGVVAPSARG